MSLVLPISPHAGRDFNDFGNSLMLCDIVNTNNFLQDVYSTKQV